MHDVNAVEEVTQFISQGGARDMPAITEIEAILIEIANLS